MDTQLKEKWVAALRSGEYQQYRGGANDRMFDIRQPQVKSRCCINVGAHVAVGARADSMYTMLCAETIGLEEDEMDSLIRMNDREQKSFAEIADWIEKNL